MLGHPFRLKEHTGWLWLYVLLLLGFERRYLTLPSNRGVSRGKNFDTLTPVQRQPQSNFVSFKQFLQKTSIWWEKVQRSDPCSCPKRTSKKSHTDNYPDRTFENVVIQVLYVLRFFFWDPLITVQRVQCSSDPLGWIKNTDNLIKKFTSK